MFNPPQEGPVVKDAEKKAEDNNQKLLDQRNFEDVVVGLPAHPPSSLVGGRGQGLGQ